MKLIRTIVGCVLFTTAVPVAAALVPHSADEPPAPSLAERQASMDEMPGRELLGKQVGAWDVKLKIYMGGPDRPPILARGESTVEWVLDEKFIVERTTYEVAMPGMPKPMVMQGMGMAGYDAHRNMFTGTWADSMNGTLYTMTGSADPTGSRLTMYGEMDEPALNVYGRMVKYVTHFKSADHLVLEMIDLHAGDDYTVLEVEYTRK